MIRYYKYKDSGVDWLGEIPEQWKLKSVKNVAWINNKALTEKTPKEYCFKYIDIGNVNQNGIIEEPEDISFFDAPSRARRIVKHNDVIVSTVRTYLKAVAFLENIPNNTIVSTGFAVLAHKKNVEPNYLAYFIQSELFVDSVIRNSIGVSYPAINSSTLSSLLMFSPPISEQISIASYLNRKTSTIDRKVALLEQKITHYQQLRKSLINETVCRGLDKNVKLKDSGIEWIGKIPEHWEVKRLKDMDEIIMGQSPNSEDFNYDFIGFPFLQGNAEFGLLHPSPSTWCSTANKVINTKDILVSVRAPIGAINISDRQYGIGRGLCAVRGKKSYYKFLYYHFSVRTEDLNSVGTGTTYIAISLNGIRNLFVAYPPISEQTAIATYLDEKTQKIDSIVSNIKAQIGTLKELRKTLINDVVTGKIKVSS